MSQNARDALPVDGPWDLEVAGFEVSHMTLSVHVDITAYGKPARSPAEDRVVAPSAMLRLAGSFSLREPDGREVALDPSRQDWDDLRPLFALRGDRITSARASNSGQLQVEFTSGRALSAGPDRDYENWEIHAPGALLIAMPGGGVAVFPDPPA
jgi:hypothetical protein